MNKIAFHQGVCLRSNTSMAVETAVIQPSENTNRFANRHTWVAPPQGRCALPRRVIRSAVQLSKRRRLAELDLPSYTDWLTLIVALGTWEGGKEQEQRHQAASPPEHPYTTPAFLEQRANRCEVHV